MLPKACHMCYCSTATARTVAKKCSGFAERTISSYLVILCTAPMPSRNHRDSIRHTELVLLYFGSEHLLHQSDLAAHQQFITHNMAKKFANTATKLFPLGRCQKLDGVGNIRVCKDLRDQQEHFQLNVVEEKAGNTTIRNEEIARQPGDICGGEMAARPCSWHVRWLSV
jgi:hypothetical protein